jgi:hypothetical protein
MLLLQVLDCIASVAADVSEQAQVAAAKAAQRNNGFGEELESFSFISEQSLLSSKQLKSALQDVSNACIAESLSIMSYIYDVITDARITAFVASLRHAVAANTPLWDNMKMASRSLNVEDALLTLTPEGETKVRSLFMETSIGASSESANHRGPTDGSSGSLYCVDGYYLGGEAFLDTVLGFVLSSNHHICDKALDVLRKHFGQMQTFSRSVSELVYSDNEETSKKYLIAR